MKKLIVASIILLIFLLSLISFGGIYKKVQNRMENQVKDYSFEMGLSKYRQIVITPKPEDNQEETIQTEENTTEQSNESSVNYGEQLAKTKKIIEKRLKAIGVTNYIIRQNNDCISLEIPEDDDSDYVVTNVTTKGVFEIVDADTKEVLANNDSLKSSSILAQSTENGTVVYLKIEFKDKKVLEDITNKYRTLSSEELAALNKTEETSENSEENTEEAKQPKATLQLDGSEMTSQSFDEAITSGSIILSLSNATTNSKKLQSEVKRGKNLASILDNGSLPVDVEVTHNETVNTDITYRMVKIFVVIVAAVFMVAFIALIIKYKKIAIFACISFVGLVAIYLLIIRYANVNLSIEGIGGIIFILILNYILIRKYIQKGGIIDSYKELILELIPVLIAVVVFCFTKWANIASFGMILFWGLVLTFIYNLVITNTLLKMSAEK